ncbi:MAG TPA: methylmalonyl-CoA mutase [Firmicutes bacterium]|nr:methylmalonyl-CoA mutase [Bacillota bacterium]
MTVTVKNSRTGTKDVIRKEERPYQPQTPIRVVTAASLFDGHDAAINVMRRIIQATGCEVIHLGHNRSVMEIVDAAIDEDANAVAISSYQGGHLEFFKYMFDLLKEKGAGHIRIYGGGGGVIIPREIDELHAYGIARIYSPDDGRRLGLQGMINTLVQECDKNIWDMDNRPVDEIVKNLTPDHPLHIARTITFLERADSAPKQAEKVRESVNAVLEKRIKTIPVIGITGTGGSGKSSLCDEIVRRFLNDDVDRRVGIISIDPSRKRTGGALLGDRIRMNAAVGDRVYMRSLATRGSINELSECLPDAIRVLKAAGFDLVIVETSGIGQGDTAITSIADFSVYVMTSDYGAESQLEKIDMLDYADFIALNKYEHAGSKDALRDVRRQYRRNHRLFGEPEDSELPIIPTIANNFSDYGVNLLYLRLLDALNGKFNLGWSSSLERPTMVQVEGAKRTGIVPEHRIRYLAEIAKTVRDYHKWAKEQAQIASKLGQTYTLLCELGDEPPCRVGEYPADAPEPKNDAVRELRKLWHEYRMKIDPDVMDLLASTPELFKKYSGDEFMYEVRGKEIRQPFTSETLAGTKVPRVILPDYWDWGRFLLWQLTENVPGEFPYTAGVFPLKRAWEDPKRQFAGEGPPERTNARFHYLAKDDEAKRLSTAFDSPTLYGHDPEERPDIFGKIGESGVAISTLNDVKMLYDGFDLSAPNTSVSMTINGPAPIMLAMFMNAAIDQQVDSFMARENRKPTEKEYEEIFECTLQVVRGTVQADILKEDQAQNTCIFSTPFALKMMGDIQEFFIRHNVRNYYSVSISGYHIAEAGANPITQTAFTLANGFTYVEYYLSRGMNIDDFAPNLSYFFSNGLDAEYCVIGRVARRIWAVAMKKLYGGNDRSQKLKYHIQTSGRSLHAQEIAFNDIRTTLQAVIALFDNCQSLHTNAYDEAITTPTEESVRRAMAIQLITAKEFGWSKCENPTQGAFFTEWLTNLVEEAILQEFERISERGGVLGAMERAYQRGKIQEESLKYEHLKHTGELPIIGVNQFIDPATLADDYRPEEIPMRRATYEEKQTHLDRCRKYNADRALTQPEALARLRKVALDGGNIFEELMHTVRHASLGVISQTLYEVGGQYRRNM